MTRLLSSGLATLFLLAASAGSADPLACNLFSYKPLSGLSAARDDEGIVRRAGKKWVRFAAWDSAGNGVMSQPRKLSASTSTAAGR